MKTKLPYWLRQMKGAEKRAATHRGMAKVGRDVKWRLMMARAAEKDAARCFARWRAENRTAPNPFLPGGEFFQGL